MFVWVPSPTLSTPCSLWVLFHLFSEQLCEPWVRVGSQRTGKVLGPGVREPGSGLYVVTGSVCPSVWPTPSGLSSLVMGASLCGEAPWGQAGGIRHAAGLGEWGELGASALSNGGSCCSAPAAACQAQLASYCHC